MKIFLFFVLISFSSCFLFSDFRKSNFSNGDQNISLIVPKKYKKIRNETDSLGNQQKFYEYEDGSFIFLTTMSDTSSFYLPLDTSLHIAQPNAAGGRYYKGVFPDLRFWREVKIGKLRYGYFNAAYESEGVYDSAINYIRLK